MNKVGKVDYSPWKNKKSSDLHKEILSLREIVSDMQATLISLSRKVALLENELKGNSRVSGQQDTSSSN